MSYIQRRDLGLRGVGLNFGFLLPLAMLMPVSQTNDVGVTASFTPLVEVRFQSETDFITFDSALVRDDLYSYLATPGGLYRLPRGIRAGAQPQLIGFGEQRVHNLYVNDGALYVLKNGKESDGVPATDHTFLRSDDHGATFTPLDQKLEECLGRYCAFLSPTEAVFRNGAIIVNAGGNVLATRDQGKSWTPLVGSIAAQACYHPTLASIDDRLLIGGECPLDVAYIRRGILSNDSQRWVEEPAPVATPFLENRNVQFIRRLRATETVIAGIEGGILRSENRGDSFDFVFRQSIEATSSYIYFTTFLAPEKSSRLVIGGFDKATMTAALMISDDDGKSWKNRSYLLAFPGRAFDALVFLHEDEEGRILGGLLDWDEKLLSIVELRLDSSRRRPVRPRLAAAVPASR